MKATKFGLTLVGTMLAATLIGLGDGIWCIWEHDAGGAFVSGILFIMPFSMIVGKVLLADDKNAKPHP